MSDWCEVCGGEAVHPHDHKSDQSGLDDGPYLPGCAPRRKPAPKSPAEMRAIRAKAWATRRRAEAPESPAGKRDGAKGNPGAR